MANEGVKCEDCGELPLMDRSSVAKDEVYFVLACQCGMKGQSHQRSLTAAITQWETSGYRKARNGE